MNAYIEGDPDVRHYAVSTDFKLGRALGKGAFAKVVLGTSRKSKSLPIRAVKIIDVKALSQTDIDALDLEIKTMRRVAHHNIVGLYEIYSFADKFVMVLELCKGGELFDRIVVKEHYSETEARFSFAQMVEAIGHCHTKGVVHRDLKPENLLYEDVLGTPGQDTVKLADFGLASLLSKSHALTTACGTPGYVSPEILTASKTGGYGQECDLWSLGVILYILLCGYPPFYDENNNNAVIFRAIKAGKFDFADPYWTDISEDAKSLVKRLLTVDPTKRITANEVFQHVWLTKATEEVSNLHLPHFIDNMQKYNLRRKFKGAVAAVMAERRISTNYFRRPSAPVVTAPVSVSPPRASAAKPRASATKSPLQPAADAATVAAAAAPPPVVSS